MLGNRYQKFDHLGMPFFVDWPGLLVPPRAKVGHAPDQAFVIDGFSLPIFRVLLAHVAEDVRAFLLTGTGQPPMPSGGEKVAMESFVGTDPLAA